MTEQTLETRVAELERRVSSLEDVGPQVDLSKLPVDVRVAELEARVAALERAKRQQLKPLEDRVRQLESTIEDLRRALSPPPQRLWHESGTIHPELDDQMIAP
jgi:tetrahydromethanopterin S-methyltransferase subunit B